jgi:cell wall-associated NlpC family hydrolase
MEVQAPDAGSSRLSRAAALAAVALCGVAVAACGREPQSADSPKQDASSSEEVVLTPEAAREGRQNHRDDQPKRRTKAQVVQVEGVGANRDGTAASGAAGDAPSPGAPTDAEVRKELRQARAALASFKKHLDTTAFLQTGPRARVLSDGTAVAPDNAPEVVKRVILAGNEIAKFPYKWGGGHGAWRDTGYDCSGSVSFALAGAGLLGRPLTSGLFMNWGAPGPGRWITIYASPGHIFMYVAGLRFDTSGQGRAGTRWQEETRSTAGFAVRHIPGL